MKIFLKYLRTRRATATSMKMKSVEMERRLERILRSVKKATTAVATSMTMVA